MNIAAVIVAGGRSSRMGREKAFATVRNRTIISRIITQLTPQVDRILINANGGEERFWEFGLQLIADVLPARTPLAGLHAALSAAGVRGFHAVLTVPSDAPFLPADLVLRLKSSCEDAAIASSGGQQHFLTGLWSPKLRQTLELALGQSQPPRLQDWARTCRAAVIDWPMEPYDPFFNVNTPEELAEAERIAAEFGL